jgi:nucleoside phosphorylase
LPGGKKSAVLILAPTPAELEGVSRHLRGAAFRRLEPELLRSGPGKINAAACLAGALASAACGGGPPAFVAGAGTSGSLSLELQAGEVVFSLDSVVGDWRHDDGREVAVGPYGAFEYGPPDPERVESMALRCSVPPLPRLQAELAGRGFRTGRVLTTDSFIASREHKLSLGRIFGALVCDMESGAFAWTAGRLSGLPWFNLRVVADTLDESLSDYFDKEKDATDALGAGTLEALKALDGLLE